MTQAARSAARSEAQAAGSKSRPRSERQSPQAREADAQ
jgi:hypothetical protein